MTRTSLPRFWDWRTGSKGSRSCAQETWKVCPRTRSSDEGSKGLGAAEKHFDKGSGFVSTAADSQGRGRSQALFRRAGPRGWRLGGRHAHIRNGSGGCWTYVDMETLGPLTTLTGSDFVDGPNSHRRGTWGSRRTNPHDPIRFWAGPGNSRLESLELLRSVRLEGNHRPRTGRSVRTKMEANPGDPYPAKNYPPDPLPGAARFAIGLSERPRSTAAGNCCRRPTKLQVELHAHGTGATHGDRPKCAEEREGGPWVHPIRLPHHDDRRGPTAMVTGQQRSAARTSAPSGSPAVVAPSSVGNIKAANPTHLVVESKPALIAAALSLQVFGRRGVTSSSPMMMVSSGQLLRLGLPPASGLSNRSWQWWPRH